MNDFMIRRLSSGGLITNYFCTSRCRHCLYYCSPNWEKLYIDPETAEKCFGRILELGCRSVHIGVGVRIEDLGKPFSKEKYPVLTTLAESGIRGLHDMTFNEYSYQPKTNRFLNKCDLCTQIRKFLVNTHAEFFKELAPFNFYSEMPKD